MSATGTATRDTSQDDHIEDLGDEIARLAAHIHAATQRMLALLAEFDRLRGWERSGHRDCADWLSSRTGIDRGAAQEKVRAARALVGLPLMRAAMGRGELSFSKVRALTRVAAPENEREWSNWLAASPRRSSSAWSAPGERDRARTKPGGSARVMSPGRSRSSPTTKGCTW